MAQPPAHTHSMLDRRLRQIGADTQALLRSLPVPCLFPPTPWHIVAKKRARQAMDELLERRQRQGWHHWMPYWAQVNHTENWLREAIRSHRFERGNSATQTFGRPAP